MADSIVTQVSRDGKQAPIAGGAAVNKKEGGSKRRLLGSCFNRTRKAEVAAPTVPDVSLTGVDGKSLLGPQPAALKGRKTLVLDLDETLVHASFRPVPNADFVVPVAIDGTVHQVYVCKRPGVEEFLTAMGELYEVVVFTASLSKYANPVIDLLDVNSVVTDRLYREHCSQYLGTYTKDMALMGRRLEDTIIVDNSPASYVLSVSNAVPIGSWFDDPEDVELADLIPFLTALAAVDDVRSVLDPALSSAAAEL